MSPASPLVPTSGAWWGIYPHKNSGESLTSAVARREVWAGRKFDALRIYCDSSTGGNSVLGGTDQAALAGQGYKLFISQATRIYGGAEYTWAQAATGDLDAAFHQTGQRLAALGLPVWFSLDIEFEGKSHTTENPADFVAMWRRAYDIIVNQEGATKVDWVWTPAGWSGHWDILSNCWPGNDVVKAVAWDPYRSSAPSGTPVIDTYGLYEHLESATWLDTSKLYYMLAEWGVYEGDGRPQWLLGIPDAVKALPKLKGVFYFDSEGFPQYVLDDTASQQAFAIAGQDPYLNP